VKALSRTAHAGATVLLCTDKNSINGQYFCFQQKYDKLIGILKVQTFKTPTNSTNSLSVLNVVKALSRTAHAGATVLLCTDKNSINGQYFCFQQKYDKLIGILKVQRCKGAKV